MSILVIFFIIQIILLVLFIVNDLTLNKKKVKENLLLKIKQLQKEFKSLKQKNYKEEEEKVNQKNFVILFEKSKSTSCLKKRKRNVIKKKSCFSNKGIFVKIIFLFLFYKILFGFFQFFICKFSKENLNDENLFSDKKNKKFKEVRIRKLNKKIRLKYIKAKMLKNEINKKIKKKILRLNYVISKKRKFTNMPVIEEI